MLATVIIIIKDIKACVEKYFTGPLKLELGVLETIITKKVSRLNSIINQVKKNLDVLIPKKIETMFNKKDQYAIKSLI